MYVSNRKHGYRVVKKFKRTPRIKLINRYGCEFTVTEQALKENGYKFIQSKPVSF